MRSHYAVKAILDAYGADALDRCGTPARAAALAADIAEIVAEDGLSFEEAAELHAQRVGGSDNLPGYLDCIQPGR